MNMKKLCKAYFVTSLLMIDLSINFEVKFNKNVANGNPIFIKSCE